MKARSTQTYGQAKEAVNRVKQEKIIQCAELYMMENPTKLQPRFDVIEISFKIDCGKMQILSMTHIENAFGN